MGWDRGNLGFQRGNLGWERDGIGARCDGSRGKAPNPSWRDDLVRGRMANPARFPALLLCRSNPWRMNAEEKFSLF